ncbi:hypothetical protein PO909_033282 [Leuciscus waleckii]
MCALFISAPPLFSSARAARRKRCQWHMACHCAKHPYYRQVHQSQLWPCERRVWVPDRWCLELTCCYDITTETLGSPQKPTPTLETAKREIPRLEVPTESAELQQIIDKLFKPTVRDPGSEPRTCQLIRNICHRGNVYEFDSGHFRPNVFVATQSDTSEQGQRGCVLPASPSPTDTTTTVLNAGRQRCLLALPGASADSAWSQTYSAATPSHQTQSHRTHSHTHTLRDPGLLLLSPADG